MRRYYLHTRHGIFYAELVTQEGRKLTARSTGKTTEDEALLVVAEWLKNGIPSGRKRRLRPADVVMGLDGILKAIRKTDFNGDDAMLIASALKDRGLISVSTGKAGEGSVPFPVFLETFWDYAASPYVREKLAHGHSIGKRHCYESTNRVRQHYFPAFEDRPLNSITRQDLKEFSLSLKDKGYSASSINKILVCGSTALAWAFREGLIPHDPTAGLVRFSGEAKKRGILTPGEAEAVFNAPWMDKRAYVGNLLSITTGMRSGEVLAVRKSDIGDRVLSVRHSWSHLDGLKSPKNGEERKVPLLPEVREALMGLLEENPHKVDNPFVFYGLFEDKPMYCKSLVRGLKEACSLAGIDAAARGIVFHSHRHYYAARMTDRMTADQISRITGHKSLAVYEEYADHITNENLEEVGAVGAEVFRNVLQFRKGA
ncbi:MAG: tyrosine-type recombinase/integrase [Treponema sp.]|jgi:integrase|nr:tyrosine-type recombinase/integrase [Treponema sp.]